MEQDAVREAVKLARQVAGVNARELAFRMRKHQTFIYRVEAGTRTLDVVEFLDLAKALELDPETLFQMVLDHVRARTSANPTVTEAGDEVGPRPDRQ